jgi:ligand-binding sensor domain-containing protein
VTPSAHADGTVYVTQRGREDDDFAAYIYKSTDFGKTFRSITNNIPAGPVNVIREDPKNPEILYAGTDFGVYVSTNGGGRWEVLGSNLPSVQVSDLQISSRDGLIVISTYGRGMWVFDATKVAVK